MIASPYLRHTQMALGRASVLKAIDFACIIEGQPVGRGGTDRTAWIADRLVEAFDIYLGGNADRSTEQLLVEFHRAHYLGAGAILARKKRGRPAMPHLVAYLAAFRVLLETINPTWRRMGWTTYPGADEANNDWLAQELREEIENGRAPPLKARAGNGRSMTVFEEIATAWLRWNDHPGVTWSRSITEKAKQLHRLNLANRLSHRARRGNHRQHRPNWN